VVPLVQVSGSSRRDVRALDAGVGDAVLEEIVAEARAALEVVVLQITTMQADASTRGRSRGPFQVPTLVP
jgi:hypothetical protein